MKKAEIIAKIAEKSGLTNAESEKALEAVLDTIKESLAAGEKITFLGFGSFSVRERPAHTGRNLQTKEEIEIPAGKTPVFKAGKALKDCVK